MYGWCDGEGLLGVRVPDKSLSYDENFNFSVTELEVGVAPKFPEPMGWIYRRGQNPENAQ